MNFKIFICLNLIILCSTAGVLADYDHWTSRSVGMAAYASYCPTSQLNTWTCYCCDSSQQLTMLNYLSAPAQQLFGYLSYDANNNRIVLAFRGTVERDLQNWIIDAKSSIHADYPFGGRVASGFYNAFLALQDQVLQAVGTARSNYPSAPLYITGHSLGGALAVLAAAALSQAVPASNIHLFTYGCPRVFDSTAASWFMNLGLAESWRVVNDDDLVAHVPIMSIGYHHIGTEVWYSDSSDYQVCNGSGEDSHCSDSVLFPVSISDHLHYFGVFEQCSSQATTSSSLSS